jgi:hypothetical protein
MLAICHPNKGWQFGNFNLSENELKNASQIHKFLALFTVISRALFTK